MKFNSVIHKLTEIANSVFQNPGDLLINVIGEFIADPLEKVFGAVCKKIGQERAYAQLRKKLEKMSDGQVAAFLDALQAETADQSERGEKDKLTLSAKAGSKQFAKELLRQVVSSIGGEREVREFFEEFAVFRGADESLQQICVAVFCEVKQYYLGREIRQEDRVAVNTLLCYIDKRFGSINGERLDLKLLQEIYGMLSQLLNQSGGKAGGVSVEQIDKDVDRLRWRLRKCRSCGYDGEQFSYDDTGKLVICGACGATYEAIQDVDGYATAVGPQLDRVRDEILSQIRDRLAPAGAQARGISDRMDELSEKVDGLVKKLATKEYLYGSDDSLGADFVGRMQGELSALGDSLKESDDPVGQIAEKSKQLSRQIETFDMNLGLGLNARAESEERVREIEARVRELKAQQAQQLSRKKRPGAKAFASRQLQRVSASLQKEETELRKEKEWLARLERVTDGIRAGGYREKEEEWHRQQPCEFFFEYNVRLGEHSPGLDEEKLGEYAPRLYVERDVLGGKGYILFSVFEPWSRYAGECGGSKPDFSGALFDCADISYMRGARRAEEVDGAGCTPARSRVLLAKGMRGETAEVSYYVDNDFREIIANSQKGKNFSGCGKVRFTRRGSNNFAEYWFFVNFAFRVRIPYRVVKPKGKKKAFARVWSRIKEDQERTLSLGLFRQGAFLHAALQERQVDWNREGRGAVSRPFSVTEAERVALGKKVRLSADLSAQADADGAAGHFCLGFMSETDEKYCLLEDETPENAQPLVQGAAEGQGGGASSLNEASARALRGREAVRKKLSEVTPQKFVCPYCHQRIRLSDERAVAQYRSGGISCDGVRLSKGDVMQSGGTAPVSDRLYCKDDLAESGGNRVFKGGWNRLLPAEYLKRINYRIAVVGRKQSGKTVFLSRLLGIDGDGKADCLPLRNSCDGLFTAEACPIDAVDVSTNSISDRWERATSSEGGRLYKELGIDLPAGKFPQTTQQSAQLQHCPLFVDVHGRSTGIDSYISLYDIAGEDVEHGKNMGFITALETLGCFLIIDGDFNRTSENFRVAEELHRRIAANGSSQMTDVPLAVILTKFDQREQDFSPDAHCLRGDIPDMISADGRYAGSALERNIDMASAEIYSYLKNHPRMTNVDQCVRHFRNVKFFGISSLGFADAVGKSGSSDTSTRRMRFLTSPKRVELPFVWMMKQFGIIE